jgi:hypothetical protein
MKKYIAFCYLAVFALVTNGQTTAGELSFGFTSLPNDGNFSPRHVLAVWVEDSGGKFIQTLKLRADKRKQYLYTWNNVTSGNTTDAITGATLNSHETHNLNWNLTDAGGNLIADGDYKIRVEYTSAHAQGPLLEIIFNKSAETLSLQPSNATYFENISLNYTPESTTGNAPSLLQEKIKYWPNPVKNFITFSLYFYEKEELSIGLYDINLKNVATIFSGDTPTGENSFTWNVDRSLIKPGNYFIVIQNSKSIYSERIIIVE